MYEKETLIEGEMLRGGETPEKQ